MEFEAERRPVASRSRAMNRPSEVDGVVLTDIDIPFERMIVVLVKWSLAAIPAAIIMGLVYFFLYWIAVKLYLRANGIP